MGSPANVITITVKCDLDLDEIYGRVHVYCNQDRSMDWVLEEFCREKNVKRVSTFALRSSSGADLDLTKSIGECGLGDGDLIFCYNKNPPKPKPPPSSRQKSSGICSIFCALAVIFLLIALAGILTVVLLHEYSTYKQRTYTVVVDAGSTSSKIYLYSWPSSLFFNTGRVQQDVYYKEERALSDFVGSPKDASGPIIAAVRKAILNRKLVPSKQIASTPLYLGATAGMRMLRDRQPRDVSQLFSQLRIDLKDLGLQLLDPTRQVRIISGTEEGMDAWITVNYLDGTLGRFVDNIFTMPSDVYTVGSLDLGGASTQIAFVPRSSDVAANGTGMNQIQLYGRGYNVYSHSFLCYGKSQAESRIFAILAQDQNYTTHNLSNPCLPAGYKRTMNASEFLLVPCTSGKHAISSYGYEFKVPSWVKKDTVFSFYGIGSYLSCKAMTKRIFPTTACPYGGSNCSINGVYQPPLNGNFKAFAGYYFVAKFFNATATLHRRKATMAEFEASVRKYCANDWKTIVTNHGASLYNAFYCFDGIYVQMLLNSYGFSSSTWSKLEFVNKVDVSNGVKVQGSTVGWSLGFAVLESGRIPVESFISISMPLFIGLLILFCIIFIMAIILFMVALQKSKGRGRFNANIGSDTTGYGSI